MKNLNINQYLILMFLVALLIAGCGGGGGGSEVSENVTENKFSIPDTVREEFELDAYYKQWVDAGGLPVVSGENVSPYALAEAAWLIQQVIGHRLDVLKAMAEKKVRFSVIPYNSTSAQIPEIDLDRFPDGGKVISRSFAIWGGQPVPVLGVGEEHLLNYPGDPDEQISQGDPFELSNLIYRLSMLMLELELFRFVPDFDDRLKTAYDETRKKDSNFNLSIRHYWARASRTWFSVYRENFKASVPELATLLTDAFGDSEWRYTPVATRIDDLPHLEGFDPKNSPTFEWRPEFFECDPNEDRCDEWVNLKQYDPSELSSLITRVRGMTKVIFINTTSADIFLYFKNFDGNVEPHRYENGDQVKISRNKIHRVDAQNTHVFVIGNQDGENLAVFQAQEKTGFAVYRENN